MACECKYMFSNYPIERNREQKDDQVISITNNKSFVY